MDLKLGFVIAVALFLGAFQPVGEAASPPILLRAHYECLWWSPDQFRGFDPNHPPDKATVTILTKWEYSDPVSVPHPDVITLVATIASGEAVPSLRIRWLTRTGWVEPKQPASTPKRDGFGEPASYRSRQQLRAIIPAGSEPFCPLGGEGLARLICLSNLATDQEQIVHAFVHRSALQARPILHQAGSVTTARMPPPARLPSTTSPPWARTMLRAIGRPNPVPPVSRLRLSSTR